MQTAQVSHLQFELTAFPSRASQPKVICDESELLRPQAVDTLALNMTNMERSQRHTPCTGNLV